MFKLYKFKNTNKTPCNNLISNLVLKFLVKYLDKT